MSLTLFLSFSKYHLKWFLNDGRTIPASPQGLAKWEKIIFLLNFVAFLFCLIIASMATESLSTVFSGKCTACYLQYVLLLSLDFLGVGGVTSMCTIVSASGNRMHSKQLTDKWTFRMPWLWILGEPIQYTDTKRESFLWAFWVCFSLDLFVLFPSEVIVEWNIETNSTVMNRIPLSLCGTCCSSVDCHLAQSRQLSHEQMDGWMNKWMNE